MKKLVCFHKKFRKFSGHLQKICYNDSCVIMVLYMMRDTIQTEEDVRKYLGLNTLAAIPKEKRRA